MEKNFQSLKTFFYDANGVLFDELTNKLSMFSFLRNISTLFIFSILITSSSLLAQIPANFQGEVDALVEKDFSIDASKKTIVFTGSSSIRMWTNVQDAFPAINAVNTGFGGSQFSDLIHFREELIFKYNPDKIFIYEGDNDVASGKSKYEIFADATRLLSFIREAFPEVPVYFISPKPSISRWALQNEYEEFNALLKHLCEFDDSIQYVDVWNPMLNEKGEPMSDIFISDNLHMNAKGYEIWKEVIGKYVD